MSSVGFEIALIPEWLRTEVLQEQIDSKGVLTEKSSTAESVKFALLFEFDGDEKAYSKEAKDDQVLPEILELWGTNMLTDVESKKA